MKSIVTVSFALLISLTSVTAQAVSVEAIGRSHIIDGNLDRARTNAVQRAKEQASLFAMAQIATTQSIHDGILEIDNLRVNTLSRVKNLEILSERIDGNQLSVHIRVDLDPQQGCADQSKATAYKKSIATLQWTLAHPSQANLGGLHSLVTWLPDRLHQQLDTEPHIRAIKATQTKLPSSLGTNALSPLAQTELTALTASLNIQYLLKGRITNLAMEKPISDTQNVLIDNPVTDLVRRQGLLNPVDLRFFEAEIDLLDAATGDLLQRYRIIDQAAWRLPIHDKTRSLQAFAEQPYGQVVIKQIEQLADSISDAVQCQPMQANILRAAGDQIWIDQGADSGINPGDRLSVARRVQIYDANMQPLTEVVPTNLTLRIDRVEPSRSIGTLSERSELANIQENDIVIGY